VQKYAIRIDYIQSALMILMAESKWNALSPAQRKAMLDAAAATEQWASKRTWEISDKSIQLLKEKGMEIVEPDLAPFKASAARALSALDGQLWSKGTLEKIAAER